MKQKEIKLQEDLELEQKMKESMFVIGIHLPITAAFRFSEKN